MFEDQAYPGLVLGEGSKRSSRKAKLTRSCHKAELARSCHKAELASSCPKTSRVPGDPLKSQRGVGHHSDQAPGHRGCCLARHALEPPAQPPPLFVQSGGTRERSLSTGCFLVRLLYLGNRQGLPF